MPWPFIPIIIRNARENVRNRIVQEVVDILVPKTPAPPPPTGNNQGTQNCQNTTPESDQDQPQKQ